MQSALDDAVGDVLRSCARRSWRRTRWSSSSATTAGPPPATTSRNDPLRGYKGQVLEGGIRVPFMMQWKGMIPAGKTYEKPVISLDIHPTAVAAAGVKEGAGHGGRWREGRCNHSGGGGNNGHCNGGRRRHGKAPRRREPTAAARGEKRCRAPRVPLLAIRQAVCGAARQLEAPAHGRHPEPVRSRRRSRRIEGSFRGRSRRSRSNSPTRSTSGMPNSSPRCGRTSPAHRAKPRMQASPRAGPPDPARWTPPPPAQEQPAAPERLFSGKLRRPDRDRNPLLRHGRRDGHGSLVNHALPPKHEVDTHWCAP